MNQGPYFYETHLYWKGRRRGLVEVAELPPVTTSAPPEFQGEPGYWTPEHLLVAALESCLMTTFSGHRGEVAPRGGFLPLFRTCQAGEH